MEIPKIIHQTWKNESIPVQLINCVNSWKANHEDWKYILWTDEMNYNFLEKHYPLFLPIYNNYESAIQKVDAVRYFILYHFGGVYIDLDFYCFKNISPIISGADCAFGLEHDDHVLVHKKNMIISNAIMASKPGSKFFKLLCNELYEAEITVFNDRNEMVLETTGPFMLTRVYERNRKNTLLNVHIIKSDYLYPLPKDTINQELQVNIENGIISDELKSAYALHYYWGSWWNAYSS